MNSALFKTACTVSIVLAAMTAHAQSAIEQLIEQTGVKPGEVAVRDVPGWRPPSKIVVRDIGVSQDAFREALPGVEVVIVGSEREAVRKAGGSDAVIGWCSDRLLSAAKNAVWVQIYGAGAERCLSNERILDGSMVLTNMQKMASPVIAEHVLAMTLSLARSLPQFAKTMPDGAWRDDSESTRRMQSIAGKTMLVAGLGGIGTEVARRAAALNMRVIGTRRSSREGPDFVEYVGLSDELKQLAGRADFIVNALPLTAETEGLFDEAFFGAAKPGAYFVNVGRGRSVVTDDLVTALKSGRIAGAALDVTDPEPLPARHPLWQMDNVLITPHVAGYGSNRERHAVLLLENLRRFKAGDALLNVVDPDAGY